MKNLTSIFAFLLYFCFSGEAAISAGKISKVDKSLRLIEFSETNRTWLTQDEVDALKSECGAGEGFIDITDHLDLSNEAAPPSPPLPSKLNHQLYIMSLFDKINVDRMKKCNDDLTVFYNRYYNVDSGAASAKVLFDKMTQIASLRSDVTVEYFPHTWKQPSIIGKIIGTKNPEISVIVGGHQDSIAGGANSKAPGSDDDGSGSCSVLESFTILTEAGFQPEYTLEFQLYAANFDQRSLNFKEPHYTEEEVGLRGSQAIAESYQQNNVVIVGQLQHDMTWYVGNTPKPMGLITDYTNADLNAFVKMLISEYSVIGFKEGKCGYGCSDHASFTKAGYRASFPFEAPWGETNPYIHTASDVIQYLDLERGKQFVQVGLGFLIELSYIV